MNFMMIGLIRNIKFFYYDNNINYNDIYMIKPFVEVLHFLIRITTNSLNKTNLL